MISTLLIPFRSLLPALACVVLVSGLARADLVAHYAFDEAIDDGALVVDSLRQNPGTLIGPANVTHDVAPARPYLGAAFEFGLRGGVDLGTGRAVRPVDQFTITWWMRPDTLDAFDRIYETLGGTGNDGNGIRIDLGPSPGTRVRVLLRDGNGVSNTQHTHSLPMRADGTWYFVAVRYDSTTGDGNALRLTVLEDSSPGSSEAIAGATESPATLGTGPIDIHASGAFLAADDAAAQGANDFGGGLDDFAFFQTGDALGVLSDADLSAIYTRGALAFDPPESPPIISSFATSATAINSGSPVTLTWRADDFESIGIEPEIGSVGAHTNDGVGSLEITPMATTIYTLVATNPVGPTVSKVQVIVDEQLLHPTLSEFVADNRTSLLDGHGNASDWIEIHNPNLVPLHLDGYHLTDDPSELTRWTVPAGTIMPPESFLILFASNHPEDDHVDPDGYLHTNFALRASGEYLALVAPDGTTILNEFSPSYPEQHEDASYGLDGFFLEPTPGQSNELGGVLGFVEDTRFSIDRGFFSDPINVEITTATADARIYYTTNGTEPSPDNGELYSTPVKISTTTVLRAAAFKEGFAPTNVDSHSYIFLEDVVRQGRRHRGYPPLWAGEPAHYQMNPEIVNDPAYGPEMLAALQTFPTLSIAINPAEMFGSQGIYQHPQSQGPAWERAVSAELISPDGSERGFQIDAGMRIQGGSSRNPDIPKHSLSLRFRREYGAGKLSYPMFADAPFGESAVEEFDFLQLRAGFNFAWPHRHYYQSRHAQYNRDQWVNDLYLAMGHPGSHGRWVHLYLNGLYWGIYHVHERPDGDFMASYFGGESEDYDALSSGSARNGDTVAWNTMLSIASGNIADPRTYARIQQYLNVDSLIDYMLLNFYVGNTDWDGHNWRAARKREEGAGYLMLPWDSEFALSPNGPGRINNPQPLSNALNINVTGRNGSNRPSGLHQDLTANREYVMRFADRAHKHLFHDGALAPAQAEATWRARSDLMDDAIIAESARWGNYRSDVDAGSWPVANFDSYTKNEHYLPDQAWILGTYIQRRSGILVGQLRARGLYPDLEAPLFRHHGGTLPLGASLSISNPNGTGRIYYTLDGNDPRDPEAGGNLISDSAIRYSAPPTLTESGFVRARAFDGTEWSALNEAFFLVGPPATADNLAVSELMYNPPGGSEDTEFIELVNLSATDTIELGRAQFVAGIDFEFAPNTRLAPGSYILVVANTTAFESVHGAGHAIAGEFSGSLDNDGERVVLNDANGAEILNFRYNDGAQWPQEADGNGHSLVVRHPAPGVDLNDALAWRDSVTPGGNPESTDATTFAGDPDIDADRDGVSALLEYAQGTDDTDPSAFVPPMRVAIDPDGHLMVSIEVNLLASDLEDGLEYSPNLATWSPLDSFERVSIERNVHGGSASITYRSPHPAASDPKREFLRRKVIIR